jgi:hypothetical protein
LRITLQHEFGHVITLTGTPEFRDRNKWLSEGIAEYIGWSPRHATDSYRKPSVQWALARVRRQVARRRIVRASERVAPGWVRSQRRCRRRGGTDGRPAAWGRVSRPAAGSRRGRRFGFRW